MAVRPEVSPGVHVLVGIGTLLGWDEQPGEIAGWGAVAADVARDIVDRQQRCEWRFAVHDDEGRLLFDGLTRRRPTRPPGQAELAGTGSRVDGVVELHIPARLLSGPVPGQQSALGRTAREAARWTALLADVAAQVAADRAIAQDPGARFPNRPQRRRTQIRYQQCIFPGCRRPARSCQIDHRDEHARGGPTIDLNLAPICGHDHTGKTDHGWRLLRLDDTRFLWVSPLGRRHVVVIPPVAPPMPGPTATPTRAGPGDEDDGFGGSVDRIWRPSIPRHRPGATASSVDAERPPG